MPFLAVAAVIVAGAVALALRLSVHVLIGALVGINLATIAIYGYDKAIAGGKRRRVPENVLHLLAIAGGSPGALLAQGLFRHKTVKASFRRVYWLIVALQLTAIGAAVWFRLRPPN
jgi:uncharacterized membrane protein YsdA (DUF1294 family)